MEVAVGDVMDVTGTLTEYYDLTEISVASIDDITVTGNTDVTYETLETAPSDWEAYESALVTLNGLTVTSDVDDYGQVETDWGILIDDLLYTHGAANGTTYASITGPLYYSYSEFKVTPRDAADLVE